MTPAQYKALREKVGTQHEVADLLGVSRPTIARREAPDGRITEEAAIAIAELSRRSDAKGQNAPVMAPGSAVPGSESTNPADR